MATTGSVKSKRKETASFQISGIVGEILLILALVLGNRSRVIRLTRGTVGDEEDPDQILGFPN